MSPTFEQLKKLVLHAGSVFYGHIAGITSNEPHYLFLLNEKPSSDADYAIVVASSRIENVARLQKIYGTNTIAELPLGSEPFLTKSTYVNCNDVKVYEIKYVKSKFDNKELKCLSYSLSEQSLKKIICCIKNSSVVSEEKKKLLPNF